MRTVVLGSNPEIEAIIARRRAWGADRFDDVEGNMTNWLDETIATVHMSHSGDTFAP